MHGLYWGYGNMEVLRTGFAASPDILGGHGAS